MIKHIIFDFGGTLFSTEKMGCFTEEMKNSFCESSMKHLQINFILSKSLYESYLYFWKERKKTNFHLPEKEISSKDCLAQALKKCNISSNDSSMIEILNSFHIEEAKYFTPLEGVINFLLDLKKENLPISIAANNPWTYSISSALKNWNPLFSKSL